MKKSIQKNWNWLVLCLAALLLSASCAGGTPAELEDEAQQDMASSSADVDLIGEPYSYSAAS
jgi:hypothetical protein